MLLSIIKWKTGVEVGEQSDATVRSMYTKESSRVQSYVSGKTLQNSLGGWYKA